MVGREIKRAVICAVGSGGDVFPFVDVGAALRRRGVEPVVIGPERYRAYAAGAGMGFESVGADDVFERIFNGTEVWHPTKGLRASWTYYAAAMRSGLPVIRRFGSPSDTVLVGSSFALATRLAQEADGFRNLTVHLSPSVIWSAACPARWAKASIPHAWPHWLRQAAISVAERTMVDPVLKRLVNPVRKDLGMAPVQRLFSRYVHAGRVAYAFAAWFAPPASDWPAQGAFAGFIRPNGKGQGLPEEVAAFLAEGDKVVVITAGTAVATRPGWIEATCRAALDLGRRAIVVGPLLPAPRSAPRSIAVSTMR